MPFLNDHLNYSLFSQHFIQSYSSLETLYNTSYRTKYPLRSSAYLALGSRFASAETISVRTTIKSHDPEALKLSDASILPT